MTATKGCRNFCNGPQNTNHGLVAMGLDVKPFAHRKLKFDNDGSAFCPLGRTLNPTSEKAAKNAIRNGGRQSICNLNKWKWIKVEC